MFQCNRFILLCLFKRVISRRIVVYNVHTLTSGFQQDIKVWCRCNGHPLLWSVWILMISYFIHITSIKIFFCTVPLLNNSGNIRMIMINSINTKNIRMSTTQTRNTFFPLSKRKGFEVYCSESYIEIHLISFIDNEWDSREGWNQLSCASLCLFVF